MRLSRYERAWLLQVFAAMLPAERAGLPGFASIDTEGFFRAIETTTGPAFVPGLRAMLHALAALPVARAGYRRPFFALAPEAQRAFLEALDGERSYLARQLVATMKILAAFAYFEDDAVRARFDLRPPGGGAP